MAKDTQIYQYEGKSYEVPKGTTPEEFNSFLSNQGTTEAKDFKPPLAPVPQLGVLGRPAMPGVSSHYAGPQSVALSPLERESRNAPGNLIKAPFKRMGLGAEELTGYAPGQTDSEVQKGLHDVVTGAGEAIAPVALPLAAAAAPVATVTGLGLGMLGQQAGHAGVKALGGSEDTANLVGDATGLVSGMFGAGSPEAVSDAAKENPDVAALKALKTGGGKKAIGSLEDVQTSRPYLKGAKNLADLQEKLPATKTEVWKPYLDALEQVGKNNVAGPDGPNTVEYYEEERLKTAAKLSAIRSSSPYLQQVADQKGEGIAALSERNTAIEAAIDPELAKTGIDPDLIRQTYGGLKGIERATEGRSTLTDNKPFGLGKMAKKFDIMHPFQSLSEIGSGIRDIAAGRPLWSGSPTDVAVKEGFRTGGDKPNLTPLTPQLPLTGTAGGVGPLFGQSGSPSPTPPPNGPQGFPTLGTQAGMRPSAPVVAPLPVGHQFDLGQATPGSLFEHTGSIGEKQRPSLFSMQPKPPALPPLGTQGELIPTPGSLFNAPHEPGTKPPTSFMTQGQMEGLKKLGYPDELIKNITPRVANTLIKGKVTVQQLMKRP